jgi:hypothetical protein
MIAAKKEGDLRPPNHVVFPVNRMVIDEVILITPGVSDSDDDAGAGRPRPAGMGGYPPGCMGG